MSLKFLNPEDSLGFDPVNDVLSVFKHSAEKNKQITEGMSPKEIADIVSEHLINNIKEQFELVRKERLNTTKS